MERTKRQIVCGSVVVLTLLLVYSCSFVLAGFVDGLPATTVITPPPSTDGSSGGGGGGTVENVTNATSNETVVSDEIVDGEDASETSGSGDSIGEEIMDIISDAKKSWVWVGVTLILLVAVIGTVVYFKKKK
ncbi:MAG: hypothetical protein ABIH79_02305 [archaeon]